MNYQDKQVAILGFGQEGQTMAEYLLREGALVTILDEREPAKLGQVYESWQGREVRWQLGPSYLKNLKQFAVIVRSPGVPLSLPALTWAQRAGVVITSQTKIFFSLCPAPIIGVTGTKGKGTTSTLIAKMLTVAKKKVFLVGNIGESSISILPKLTPRHWVVYELSSFQLQDLDKSPHDAEAMRGKPHIAVVLGLTVEHQDYHKNPEEYFAAKANILKWQKPNDALIFNIDYPETRRLAARASGKIYETSRLVPVAEGAYAAGDVIFRRINGRTEHVLYRHEIGLKGDHNLENITAAVAAATLAGVTMPAIRRALKSFMGLPHRLELVGEYGEVSYWNDSYGTTPETTIAAIRSFVQPIVLMLGGSEKKLSYDRLAECILGSSVKTIVAIGLNAEKMHAAVTRLAKARNVKPPPLVVGGETMKEMVKTARKFAKSGDVVLLSPAAASFDRFKNAGDRGDQFRAVVHKLAEHPSS